ASLAIRFSRLWEGGPSPPDVFEFLTSHHDVASSSDVLDVLLVDLRQRWLRGQPLPLRIYLSAFPEMAERGDWIRTLVDGERQERGKSAARLNETVIDRTAADALSETPTESVSVESFRPETLLDPAAATPELRTPAETATRYGDLRLTRTPALPGAGETV